MKTCPRCNQNYSDENLNFCLNDGEMLREYDDAPPTVMLDPPRVTNKTSWEQAQYQPPSQPVGSWQGGQMNAQNQQFGVMQQMRSQDQTLPTIALVLGVSALLFICCHGGVWLGIPAIVVGYLGMKNADSDPAKYGGRGMAVGGLILGAITFLMSVGIIVLSIFGSFLN